MFIDHFALGMRIPKENMDIGPKGCMEKLLSGLTRYNISGLGLSGGWVEDVYVIVIMGGSLSFMRNVYRRILANEDFVRCSARIGPLSKTTAWQECRSWSPSAWWTRTAPFSAATAALALP